ncbi:DUF3219 family protein [Salirhabdus sp. Marseille-P4669]|uniref:DUF3219 family protein n=1 Tax=Salirhabdus sp. Marseille-P4669 TaxID=2042310 RepID=UPI000C7D655C|nr:DUF3219 family protein [Salirhabdus sp. Marseille-P4669]
METVRINDYEIHPYDLKLDKIDDRKFLTLHFKVTHENYHDITTLLYKNDFIVKIPKKDIAFQANIANYSTSITNLYEEGNIGDYKLVLKEK